MHRAWVLGLLAVVAACSSGQDAVGTSGSGGTGAGGGTTGTGGTPSTDTWASYAQGFAATYCVECHGASAPTGLDFTVLADVQMKKAEIRCGVAPTLLSGCSGFPPPKQFPISNAAGTNPKPTDAERDRFIAWIDAGAM
jgi:hypothetical protein